MKKLFLVTAIVVAIGLVSYKLFFKKEKKAKEPGPVAMNVNTGDAFTNSVAQSLKAYYALQDAFVKADTMQINTAAAALEAKIKAANVKEIKADSSLVLTAAEFQSSAASEAKNITMAAGLESKRESFKSLSDVVFNLLRVVKYSGGKVYQLHCPMAFNDAGADWLSSTPTVQNPYFGSKMPECGDVQDSISFSATDTATGK